MRKSADEKKDPSTNTTHAEAVYDPDADDFDTEEGKKTISYRLTEKMAYHPIKFSLSMLFVIVVTVIVSNLLGVNSISESSQYDWVISDTAESENLDALDDAISRVDQATAVVRERSNILDAKFFYIYEAKDGGDIYTPANILHMCLVESKMLTAGGFEDVCQLTEDGNCILPSTSIVVYFYDFERVEDWNCTLLNATYVEEKKAPIYEALNTPAGQEEYGIWLSKNSIELGYSTMCDSIWHFGTPLAGYESESDRKDDQFKDYQDFVADQDGSVEGVEAELFEMFAIEDNADGMFPYYPTPYMSTAEVSTLDVSWFSLFNQQTEFLRLLTSDLFFSIFSIIFVVLWLRVHTGSFLMALSGIFMIVTSLPITILIYKVVFNIPFYSELHSLVLFIVLGVGADDIFVLNDSWQLTKHTYPDDITNGRNRETIHRRLLKCYRHTMSTVFNTSFTTSMAFIATGLSPLMPIATFGWFAATCIVCNYVLVITLMPPIAVLSEIYFHNSFIPCQEMKAPADTGGAVAVKGESDAAYSGVSAKEVEAARAQQDSPSGSGLELTPANGGEVAVMGQDDEAKADVSPARVDVVSDHGSQSDSSRLGAKLLQGYIDTLEFSVDVNGFKLRVAAIFIMVSLFAFGIVGLIYGMQLETPSSQEQWFPDGHMLEESLAVINSDFLGFDDSSYEVISVNLGISGIDRSGFNEYIPPKNRGTAKFDDNFELAQPSCQRAVMRMCEDIPLFECSASACRPTGLIARQNSTKCFMADFRTWSSETLGVDTYTMNQTYFYEKLSEFRLESADYLDEIGFIDGDLKYATVSFTSTMEAEEPMQEKRDVQDCIEGLLRQVYSYDECDSCDCKSLMFSSPYAFVWMRSEIGLVKGFYQGMYIAFPVAFGVLLFATSNLFIAFYAILTVFFIVFGVLGFANYALNWDLGVAESIAGIIIIGFSVDYTVHLGHMFTDAEKQMGYRDRVSKFEHASREIVPTVVGGAITTAGAGAFMLFCQLVFFVKMAVLIVSTILLSYIYSLGFFMSLLVVMGPEDDQGNLKVYIAWIKEKLGYGEAQPDAKKVATQDTTV